LRELLLRLRRSDVDHSAVEGADPEGVVSDAYVAKDLAQVHPDELPPLDGAHLLGYLDLGGRFRRRQDWRFALGTGVSPLGYPIPATFWTVHATSALLL
jgi:hypothetical protein